MLPMGFTGHHHTQAEKQTIANASKAQWLDPAIRARRIAGIHRHWNDYESYERHAAANRKSVRRASVRRKLSNSVSATNARPEIKAKRSRAMKRVWRENYDEMAARIRAVHTGKVRTKAELEKASRSLKQSYLDAARKNGGPSPHWKVTKFRGTTFRSSWEVLFVRWCIQRKIRWLYEPYRFPCPSGCYTPDFYLPDYGILVEIKGAMFPAFKKKFREFVRRFKALSILLLSQHELIATGLLKKA